MIHVVVARGQGRRHLVDERIHVAVRESTHLEPDQVLGVRKPPTQRQHRAAVDAASQARSEGSCRAVLAAAVQQRLVTSADLLAVVRRFPTLPRRALILETIGDVGGGAHSLPELEWNDGIRRARLPAPTRQRKVRHANGYFYLDADFDDWLVTVEINGAQHLTRCRATSTTSGGSSCPPADGSSSTSPPTSSGGTTTAPCSAPPGRCTRAAGDPVRRPNGGCGGWPKPGGSRCGSHPGRVSRPQKEAAEHRTVDRS